MTARERAGAALSRTAAATRLARASASSNSGPTSASARRSARAATISTCATTARRIRACCTWPTALDATPRVLVDPNGKREDATIALSQWVPSPNGEIARLRALRWRHRLEHLAFPPRCRRRRSAGDPQVQQVLTRVSWARDSSGVYYSRYPLKAGQSAETAERGDDAGRPDVYFHKLEDAQSADRLVYQVTDIRRTCPRRRSPKTGVISIINLFDGYEANAVLVQDLRKKDAKPQGRVRRPGTRCTTSSAPTATSCISHHQRGAARARDRGECRQSRARRMAHGRAAGRYRDHQRQLRRRPHGGRILARCVQRRAAVRDERRAGGRSEIARAGHHQGFPGQRHESRDVLLVHGLSIAARASCAWTSRRTPSAISARRTCPRISRRSSPSRCSTPARTARACPCSSRAGRMRRATATSRLSVRLRRVQREHVARVQSGDPGVDRDGRHLRRREPSRRRRIRRGVASRRHAAARSRTCSTISSRPPNT